MVVLSAAVGNQNFNHDVVDEMLNFCDFDLVVFCNQRAGNKRVLFAGFVAIKTVKMVRTNVSRAKENRATVTESRVILPLPRMYVKEFADLMSKVDKDVDAFVTVWTVD